EKVPVGTVLALINDGKAEVSESATPVEEVPKQEIHPIEDRVETPHGKTEEGERIKISPLARKIAEENHIEISSLTGTGPEGSIVKKDVEKAISEDKKPIQAAEKETEIAKESSVKPVGPASDAMRMAVAAAMSKSNREIPHYYLEKRMDMSKAMDWVKEANKERPIQKRLLPVAILIKAVAKALDEVPDLNAIWENGLQRKNEINIGFVISLRSGGIVVPAILQTDSKTVYEIMETMNDLIPRARAFKLRSSELSQSTFTITSIGEGGADKVFGLIYPPQVGIVGFGEISEQPFAEDGMLGIRPVVDVTLAADHRATDGLIGSKFLAAINKHLQNPEEL
ncbi:dihydrolipoamide acetyltransferase family protein, partial [Algoriphagus sp.]|uniref:dihydrolipoamide acetyltransferase family protein n=1 Tax=Algoriphagus sp. TaxID=1872435 RepID=UPI0025CE5689